VHAPPLVMLFLLVLVAMSAGWATPTESAALGALATVLVCLLYRSLSWAALGKALMGTTAISGVILFIILALFGLSE
jgi:TRAP-type C4-dicarboxylate transport system permease large subunit